MSDSIHVGVCCKNHCIHQCQFLYYIISYFFVYVKFILQFGCVKFWLLIRSTFILIVLLLKPLSNNTLLTASNSVLYSVAHSFSCPKFYTPIHRFIGVCKVLGIGCYGVHSVFVRILALRNRGKWQRYDTVAIFIDR